MRIMILIVITIISFSATAQTSSSFVNDYLGRLKSILPNNGTTITYSNDKVGYAIDIFNKKFITLYIANGIKQIPTFIEGKYYLIIWNNESLAFRKYNNYMLNNSNY